MIAIPQRKSTSPKTIKNYVILQLKIIFFDFNADLMMMMIADDDDDDESIISYNVSPLLKVKT